MPRPSPDATVSRPRRRKRVLVVVVALLLATAGGGAAWYSKASADPKEQATPTHPGEGPSEHGEIASLEVMSVNLVDGYARIGIALEGAIDAKEAPEGSAALDAVVELVTGMTRADLIDPTTREDLRERLTEVVSERYEDEVVAVYFTELVTQ